MKKRIFFVSMIICLGIIIAGCSTTREYGNDSKRSNDLDFSTPKTQQIKNDEENNQVWRKVSMPKDGNRKLNIELPFDFDDCRKFEDLSEIKNLETYIHKKVNSLVMINHGVIVVPNKKVRFAMDTFADLVPTVKNKELIKSEKRNINGREMSYLKCAGKAEKDNRECIMEFVGIQVDNEYWMISYYYYVNDENMAKIAERSITSIRIE